MNLQGQNIKLVPYSHADWKYLARWFYDSDYGFMWRHHTKTMTPEELQVYPSVIGGEVFLIADIATDEIIGMAQAIPDHKNNRGFYGGLIIDKKYQKKRYPLEAYIILFDYMFNRQNYRKAIVEILSKHTSLLQIVNQNGFLHEGTLRGDCFWDGEYVDEERYSMTATFYNKKFKGVLNEWRSSKTKLS